MSCGAGGRYPAAIGKTVKWMIFGAFEKATLSPVPHERFVIFFVISYYYFLLRNSLIEICSKNKPTKKRATETPFLP